MDLLTCKQNWNPRHNNCLYGPIRHVQKKTENLSDVEGLMEVQCLPDDSQVAHQVRAVA